MFKFKSPKVFEKLNKMNRKQAYTIGAIVVVVVVALLLLISAVTSGEDDDSFAGMNARGYDLAQMPFATDEAEKFLLANVYPDMQENGSSFLYTAQDKAKRQEEEGVEDPEEEEEDEVEDDDTSYPSNEGDDYDMDSSNRYGGGYGGGYGGSGRRGGKTEIGTLSSAGMASAGGSGVSGTWGPSGDYRQFRGREDKGKEKPIQLKTDDSRRALAQFRSGSVAAARINENKMKNAGKALFGGDIKGSDAFGKDGVDLSKLQEGGLTLDTSAPSTTTDLNNLDKKVAEAAKNAENKQKEKDKPNFWADLWQGLVKNMADKLVDTFTSAFGDAIVGARSAYLERTAYRSTTAGTDWDGLSKDDQNYLESKGWDETSWNGSRDMKAKGNDLKGSPGEKAANKRGFEGKSGYANESSKKKDDDTQVGVNEQYKKCIQNCTGKSGDEYTNCTKNCE